MAEQSFKIYKDTAERLDKNALDIILLKEDITDLKSVMKDIHNNTPHASMELID